ncbi:MAG: hypothetical protein D3923_00190 [Candidatus Electrothrix sp. AR3]|nr:hypothetical protein [Candidatus Electrothrix sp. AR3]
MNPSNKVITLSLALTVTFILLSLSTLIPFFKNISTAQGFFAVAISILASTGTYKFLVTVISSVILEFTFLKKMVFGKHYLEGTWVGYYQEPDKHSYLVETFEQDFDEIVVRGSSFDQSKNRKAQWTSESASFDATKGTLQYSYTCHKFKDRRVEQGIAHFSIIRDRLTTPAKHLYGYSTDVTEGDRSPAWEVKIKDIGMRHEDAIDEAVKMKQQLDEVRAS